MSHLADYRRAEEIQNACAELGLLVETAGSAVFMTPPLVAAKNHFDEASGVLEKVLR